jgi:hypothetical protein
MPYLSVLELSNEASLAEKNLTSTAYYVGHCPHSDVYVIHKTFLELALLHSSGDWMTLLFILILVATVRTEAC